jgi:tetratricopeptide (TPR) repeat protein
MGDDLSGAPSTLVDGSITSWERLAGEAIQLRGSDPVAARDLARRAREGARRHGDRGAEALATRAVALCELDLGRLSQAFAAAERSTGAARLAARPDILSGCLTTYAGISMLHGRPGLALGAIDEAASSAVGDQRLDVGMQRAWMLQRVGRWSEALVTHESLFPMAVTSQARGELLCNHGSLLAELGRFDEALQALDEAVALLDSDPTRQMQLRALHNRALCLSDAGQLPESLRQFDEIEARLHDEPIERAWLLVGEADTLLRANLANEAVPVCERAVASAGARGPIDLRAEAWWRLARASHLLGDDTAARGAARKARTLFERLGSSGQAALAQHVEVMASSGRGSRELYALVAATSALHRAGRRESLAEARVDALTLALRLGDMAEAESQRRALIAARTHGSAISRATAWLGEATWRRSAGDARGTMHAVRAGLRTLDEHRATLGATELRAHASGLGTRLAAIGVGTVLAGGRPSEVLEMSERWRAGAVLRRPAVDGDLAEALAELRHAIDPESNVPPETRIEVERRARRLARRARPEATSVVEPATLGDIRGVLFGRRLVSLVEHDGAYTAVVVTARRAELVPLGTVAEVAAAQRDVVFGLRRLARRGVSAGAVRAARASVDDAVVRMTTALVDPIAHLVAGEPVVLVPPAALHALPWQAIGNLLGSTISVAPSATWWARTPTAPGPPQNGHRRAALIAGPRLAGASDEVERLARLHPQATVLRPDEATEAAVSAAVDGADLAHFACHGQLRADHPHLSALEMADGPFTVYDFERLAAAPRRVVLSACDSGVSATRPGDELVGFLTALFSLGTREVVASVVPVSDLATTPLMLSFHGALDGMGGFPLALARAAQEVDLDDPASFAAATSFVAFGAA